jgi:hypothetical protein
MSAPWTSGFSCAGWSFEQGDQGDYACCLPFLDAGWVAVLLEPLGKTDAAVVVDALGSVRAGRLDSRVTWLHFAICHWGSRQTATLITAADFARSQEREIGCAEVREALDALAKVDAWDFGGREIQEVLCADLEVDAAGGRVVLGGDFENGGRSAAFERVEGLDLVKELAVLARLGPLRRDECAHDARVFRLVVLRLDRCGEARAGDGG